MATDITNALAKAAHEIHVDLPAITQEQARLEHKMLGRAILYIMGRGSMSREQAVDFLKRDELWRN